MTRYLLAAATVVGALSFATSASASGCDIDCLRHHICAILNCEVPDPVERCFYTTDIKFCI